MVVVHAVVRISLTHVGKKISQRRVYPHDAGESPGEIMVKLSCLLVHMPIAGWFVSMENPVKMDENRGYKPILGYFRKNCTKKSR